MAPPDFGGRRRAPVDALAHWTGGRFQTPTAHRPSALAGLALVSYFSPLDTSVAGYIRRLGAPFLAGMRSAMSLDIAIWAAGQIRYGSSLPSGII